MARIAQIRGFTLIELVVTLAVGAIVLVIAVPSYQSFVATSAVRAAAYDLMSALTYARSEAIRLGGGAQVSVQPLDGDWNTGLTVVVNGTINDGTIRNQTFSSRVQVTGDIVTYRPNGRITGAVAGFTICDAKSSATVMKRTITLDLSGRPNLVQEGTCSGA